MELRPYQRAAVQAVYRYLQDHDDNPCVVIPTGGGKGPVMATICREAVLHWNGRVLILAHVKELLEQTADKLRRVCPQVPCGLYSAGLQRRETEAPVIVAGIQSVYQRARELGRFDLILVDEAHAIAPEGDGMYRQFLAEARIVNPALRVVGLTATPFRLKTGPLCTPEHFLNSICFEVGIKELISQGYLAPLVTKAGQVRIDLEGVHTRGGEFVAEEVEERMDVPALVAAACQEILAYTAERRACLIFASGLQHARHIQQVFSEQHGLECGFVSGDTPSAERSELLARFRGETASGLFTRPPLKYLCNYGVLTTGFDAPQIDCVVLLRATMSPGLFGQMVGRGFRTTHGKTNCLVLDYGGNVLRHGPVDALRITPRGDGTAPAPAKECPECHALLATGYGCCPQCGYVFPPPERLAHAGSASEAGILTGQFHDTRYEVLDVGYSVHHKRNAGPDTPRTLRVDYRLGLSHWQSEFVCLEHTGYARQKACAWWKRRSPDPVPDTAAMAADLANAGALAPTHAITVRSIAGEKFDRIVDYTLGDRPEAIPVSASLSDSEVPF